MTYDELMNALKYHAENNCDKCPLKASKNCSTDMALEALKVIDNRQMALKTVEMALDKGDQHIMVSPDGSVSMWPDTPTKGWISVTDAKPDRDGEYMVYRGHTITEDFKTNDANDFVALDMWQADDNEWYNLYNGNRDKTVTHWMELPTAPEGWG